MSDASPAPHRHRPGSLLIALTGAVSLAVAMGIGRFAFTPLMPMMLADGVIDLPAAGWMASANYLGYLVGALLCTVQPWVWARLPGRPVLDGPRVVRGGLVATALLTMGMAWPATPAWPWLRFAAGVVSAFVFVHASGWCLGLLARRGETSLGGLMYTGPGAGIVLSGLLAGGMTAAHWRAAGGWLVFGLLALALTAAVWRNVRHEPAAAAPSGPAAATDPSGPSEAAGAAPRGEVACLAAAYGLAGFGYIVSATFLPVIARAALPGSRWLDLFWPIFGAGIVGGALLASRLRLPGDLRRALAACYVLQAVGIALSLWWPSLPGFALGSLLLGLPFTAITFFAMQEVRRLRPRQVAGTMGLLTALYGLGQIVGPPLASALLSRSASPAQGFDAALEIAAAALLAGALLYVAMQRRYPNRALPA